MNQRTIKRKRVENELLLTGELGVQSILINYCLGARNHSKPSYLVASCTPGSFLSRSWYFMSSREGVSAVTTATERDLGCSLV